MLLPCAYTNRLSYVAGDPMSLFVDSGESAVTVELVRLTPTGRAGDGLSMEAVPVPWTATGTYAAVPQEHCVGSFAHMSEVVIDGGPVASWSLGATVCRDKWAGSGRQTIIEVGFGEGDAVRVGVENGCVVVEGPSWRVGSARPLRDRVWYVVVASASDELRLYVQPVDLLYGAPELVTAAGVRTSLAPRLAVTVAGRAAEGLHMAGGMARGRARDLFTGRVEAPFVARRGLGPEEVETLASGRSEILTLLGDAAVGAWDFALRPGDEPNTVRSLVEGVPPGLLVNLPTRGVPGHNWTGRNLSFRDAPDEFAAIHFHDSDVVDVGWVPTLTAEIPADLPSAVYGVSVRTDASSDVVPVFVVPAPTRRAVAPVAVLMSTFSYLAYANEIGYGGLLDPARLTDAEVTISEAERQRLGDARLGLSLYDIHVDGSGVIYSSARRPIVNMRFEHDMWLTGAGRGFPADMYLVEWLERRGIAYEVITDAELHAEGRAAIDPYRVVVTGSHPEYCTVEMLDALEVYRDDGGALMYLGGNGFYWVTGVHSTDPLVVEVRRGAGGTRCWESPPGEAQLVSVDRPGGLWRHQGRPPQRLVGIGFGSQGWGRSEPYHLTPDAKRPEYAWIFEGVDEDPLGGYGIVMGGAAGDELDRVDATLGTPPGAVVLASSRDHSNWYQRAVEEVMMSRRDSTGGQHDPEVHADIVYFETPHGGRVFATGSMAWSGALLPNNCDNGVSRVTENVLRRFGGLE